MNIIKHLSFTAALIAVGGSAFGFNIVAGDYYSSSCFSSTVTHSSQTGQALESYTFSRSLADSIRGIQFRNGNLYTVAEKDAGFNILKLDGTGSATCLYSNVPSFVTGNISYGKLLVTNTSIYVGSQNSLFKFNIDGTGSAQSIFTDNQIFDVVAMPSGHLLVATAYSIKEITTDGTLVREIRPTGSMFVDLRGIEYDAKSGTIYATELGYSGFSFQLMKIDYSTGKIEDSVDHWYGDDLCYTNEGELLVGSRTQPMALMDSSLNTLLTFSVGDQMFVAQASSPAPVPEASTYGMLAGILSLAAICVRKVLQKRR